MLSKVTPVLPSDTSDESFFLFHNFQDFFSYEFNKGVKRFLYCSPFAVVLKEDLVHSCYFFRVFLHNLVSQQINTCNNCHRQDIRVFPNILRRAMVIGKSISGPILRKVINTKLTTTLMTGKLNPELLTADKTRSRLSLIVPSGKPKMLNTLIPTVTPTSTSIRLASIPSTVAEKVLAIFVTILQELSLNLISKWDHN